MHPFLNIATTAVRKAGTIIIKAMQDVSAIEVESGSSHQFTTDTEKYAQNAIIDILQKSYPSHAITTEHLSIEGDEHEWVIDSMNGSINLIHGVPQVCIALALKIRGKLEHAMIYDPCRDELFSATRGNGARLNHYRIRVSRLPSLRQGLVATGINPAEFRSIRLYSNILEKIHSDIIGIRIIGSPALSLAYVAAGRLDAYWESDLHPWQSAAGALIVREAGGIVTDLSGSENYLETGSIVATNMKIARQLLPLLKQSYL
jgi:myo-inositol-1(or 4)-monophosphatase